MGDVIDLGRWKARTGEAQKRRGPWLAGEAQCGACAHLWVFAVPGKVLPEAGLECPVCGAHQSVVLVGGGA